jgi:hypothetical protein
VFVILSCHELVDKLIGPLYDLVDLLYLLLLYLFVSNVKNFLVFAVLLHWPSERARE